MKNTYFFLLWQHNKFMFVLALSFVLGQAFFSFKGVETTPFFNYGMYSEPCPPKTSYNTVALYEGNQRLSLTEICAAPSFLAYQLNYYNKLLLSNGIDPVVPTIQERFGKESQVSNYLIQHLTSSKDALQKAPVWIENFIKKNDLKIKRENYEWVNNSFKKVNSILLHE